MSSAWASEPDAHGRATANADTQAEVDVMILDYLVCLAIDSSLSAAESQATAPSEEAEWQAQTIGGFQSILATAQHPLPQDLDIKLQILSVSNHMRCYTPAQPDQDCTGKPRLASIGIEFMNLCSTARSKVSETRWVETGAWFLAQAALEETHEGNTPSEDLNRLCGWTPSEPLRKSKGANVFQHRARELFPLGSASETRASNRDSELSELKAIVMRFLMDLMVTLDPPILLQLERGKLGDLSHIETQRLKERIGLH